MVYLDHLFSGTMILRPPCFAHYNKHGVAAPEFPVKNRRRQREMNVATITRGCRAVCKGRPGEVMDELTAAFVRLRAEGVTEAQAREIATDAQRLSELFPADSLGARRVVAEAFISSSCADCAVDKAYREFPLNGVWPIDPDRPPD